MGSKKPTSNKKCKQKFTFFKKNINRFGGGSGSSSFLSFWEQKIFKYFKERKKA